MKREEFKQFVDDTLEGVIQLVEQETGKTLSRRLAFRWPALNPSELITKDIAEQITQRVYIDEDHIYPCVDIGVMDILDDRTVVIEARIAGYSPRPFMKNWTGRDGPFVYMYGLNVIEKLASK